MNNTLAVEGYAPNWRKSCVVEMSFDRLVPVILKIIFTYAIHAKLHTTNYYNTFIEVAEDSKARTGNKSAAKEEKQTVAEMQYTL